MMVLTLELGMTNGFQMENSQTLKVENKLVLKYQLTLFPLVYKILWLPWGASGAPLGINKLVISDPMMLYR